MNRRLLLLPAAGLAGALLFAAPAITAPGNKYSDTTVQHDCDGGTVTYAGPLKMWPPNHKYQPFSITATADDPNDQVTYASEATHDEYADDGTELRGAGNTADDITPATAGDSRQGEVKVDYQARSERSGRGDGRVYTVTYEAEFGGEPCVGSFTIEVPHDMRGGADWK